MNIGIKIALLGIAAATAGCLGHADVMIDNPIASGKLDQQNEIIHLNNFGESNHGLPPGTLESRAKMTALDKERACFSVALHGLQSDMDLRRLTAVLKEPKNGKIEGATVWPNPLTMQSYQGLVDERIPAGSETVCTSRDANNYCLRWETRPVYRYIKVPGTVNVYESTGRLCFEHRGLITNISERAILDLFWVEMQGWMPFKHSIAFRWGFFPPPQPGKS